MTFLVSLGVYALYDPSLAGYQLVEEVAWLGESIKYKMGVDGISAPLILLTTFITPLVVIAGWDNIKNRSRAR